MRATREPGTRARGKQKIAGKRPRLTWLPRAASVIVGLITAHVKVRVMQPLRCDLDSTGTIRLLRLSVTCALLALLMTSCSRSPVGPSLGDVAVEGLSLQPTTGNATLCCCRVTGMATNSNATPVHVTVKISAFNRAEPLPLATLVYFIEDMQPGARHQIEASGFFFSCERISELKTEVDVKGLDYPER
jgi:hypothetical protein